VLYQFLEIRLVMLHFNVSHVLVLLIPQSRIPSLRLFDSIALNILANLTLLRSTSYEDVPANEVTSLTPGAIFFRNLYSWLVHFKALWEH